MPVQPSLIAGLDFGTSSLKLVLYTPDGKPVATVSEDYPTDTTNTTVEQSPRDWYNALKRALSRCDQADQIVAMGMTGQMQDLIVVDEHDAIRPAILYSDMRATLEHTQLSGNIDEWEARTKNHQDPSNLAAKLLWLAKHEPDTLRQARHLLWSPSGYIGWRLTGAATCDVTTASTTGLFDVHAVTWYLDKYREALAPLRTDTVEAQPDCPMSSLPGDTLREHGGVMQASGIVSAVDELVGGGIDREDARAGGGSEHARTSAAAWESLLPTLITDDASANIGPLSEACAADLGLRSGIPIVVAIGDAGASSCGMIGTQPGEAYIYLGTTGWVAGITQGSAQDLPHAPSAIHALALPGMQSWIRIAAVQSAGLTAKWARNTFYPGQPYEAVERAVASTAQTLTNRPLCLPGLGGERTPVRDGALRGALINVQEQTTTADCYLSALTGVAFGLRHGADQIGLAQDRMPLIGGGAASPIWQQIFADVFNATILTGAAEDPTCYWAAKTAAQAAGLEHDMPPLLSADALHSPACEGAGQVTPSALAPEYEAVRGIHRSLYDVIAPVCYALHAYKDE